MKASIGYNLHLSDGPENVQHLSREYVDGFFFSSEFGLQASLLLCLSLVLEVISQSLNSAAFQNHQGSLQVSMATPHRHTTQGSLPNNARCH